MQLTTRSYIRSITTGLYLNLPVPATFTYHPRKSTAADLPAPGPDAWQEEGQDFGNQVEDVILWLHQFTHHVVDRATRQESLGPARLEYLPTERSRTWRKAQDRPRYIPALHDKEAQALAAQEGWHRWQYVPA